MKTPVETARILSYCERQSRENQVWFGDASAKNGYPVTGNAKYIVVQAKDYLATMEQIILRHAEDRPLYLAHASSELSRILALIQRECINYGWDIVTLLKDGVDYETDVVKDPLRTPETAKYLGGMK